MTIDDQIRDEKLQFDINREEYQNIRKLKYQLYLQTKLVSMNILLVKTYYHIIKNK